MHPGLTKLITKEVGSLCFQKKIPKYDENILSQDNLLKSLT